ncbi:uncharacterized protein MONOS_13821 [Monocercomonoides exilis]|uniref:uncharacterized protein n=1 Tax=Monocercomonoides exilis TaxID=2049356 RepID=UPI00355AA74C|nr:hypothetical protein MONOS_13821 [Monocercomonoides exilis]|eukprot:MONOS_13821.1-p1 / transcript=MONOS_13821.1 / gene=MONOS_13821 / organism=Monocercomonoides_exilis_PA203 / gene_product=unspecified product / transcript_product=unspecified product / location=Mono_scaffold00889:17218-17922(-) / protein_length=215 / sequence_SO=supercontig / SO=protein_coding / is_pseudo=false
MGMSGGRNFWGTSHSFTRFLTPPRSEERGVQVQMEEAKKENFRSNLSAEQSKCGQQKEQKKKMKKEKDEKRREKGREEGGDDEDEHCQTFNSFDSTLSSAQLNTQNITVSSTFATPPFSPFPHTELFATSFVVGNPQKPFTPSSPTVESSSLKQKSFCTSNMSFPSSSPSFSISSFSLPITCAIFGKSRLGNAGVFASAVCQRQGMYLSSSASF